MDTLDNEITGEISDWIWKHSDIMPMYYGGKEKMLYFTRHKFSHFQIQKTES